MFQVGSAATLPTFCGFPHVIAYNMLKYRLIEVGETPGIPCDRRRNNSVLFFKILLSIAAHSQ